SRSGAAQRPPMLRQAQHERTFSALPQPVERSLNNSSRPEILSGFANSVTMRVATTTRFPGAAAQLDGWAGLAALANPSPLSQYSCAAIKLLAEGAAYNNECSFCLA